MDAGVGDKDKGSGPSVLRSTNAFDSSFDEEEYYYREQLISFANTIEIEIAIIVACPREHAIAS